MPRPATSRSIKQANIAQAKMLRFIEFCQFIQGGKRFTLKELATRFDASERTMRRDMVLLEFFEIDFDQDFEGQYFIADGCCPLCRKEVAHA